MTTTRISERREILTYNDADGQASYIGMWVDGIQVAAGVKSIDTQWSMWSPLLAVGNAHPLVVRTESDLRAWLNLFGDLAEHGPRVGTLHLVRST